MQKLRFSLDIKQCGRLLSFSLLLMFLLCSCGKEKGDVTTQVTELGNPMNVRYKNGTPSVYARNVWDMHSFENKIYFGGGNSSNNAPAVNAGPADLWSFNSTTRTFTKEFTLSDEQIHRIREFDKQLYIPGHDARESWDLGNFYRLEAGVWKKYRNIPEAVHVYDIYKWGSRLFAAIAPASSATNSLQVSDDNGQTWHNASCSNNGGAPQVCTCYGRIYTLFPLADSLYAHYYRSMIYTGEKDVFRYITTPQSIQLVTHNNKIMGDRIERPLVYNGQTVYILGSTTNDHQYLPIMLMRAKNHQQVYSLDTPSGALPRDILVNSKWLLVLIATKLDDGTYRNAVLATSNIDSQPVEWKELFHFTAPTFARSFEYLNSEFYFGLGCEATTLSPATGNILSVKYSF